MTDKLDFSLAQLRALTPARIALGRSGDSLPTTALLAFELAHAKARDAVHAELDVAALVATLGDIDLGCSVPLRLRSCAANRAAYLARPDWGRRLAAESVARLVAARGAVDAPDLSFVLADGLSAVAVQAHVLPLLRALVPLLRSWRCGPLVIAEQARVALGDEVGERLGARCVVVLIGERPGLSAPDSLGIYVTWAPFIGRNDAERNCISNVRPGGLAPTDAAIELAELLRRIFAAGRSGVALAGGDVDRLA